MFKIFLFISLLIFNFTLFTSTAKAVVDSLSVPNNKFGIHIISATPDESSPAAELVNTNGDWGHITFLIESKDRNENKWQEFFNDLRRRHLIPIVRLATKPLNEHWERPYEGEEQAWADFLDSLNWPTKNRYVIIYNEPNHATEWGGVVDAKSYAQILDKMITALKIRSEDFFVMNAGFDASAPHKPPKYFDEVAFLKEMDKTVPGIFEKLDGWVSHSYPNPEFSGSPDALGRGTVRGWFWELQQLRNMGVVKNLPVFITETGWKHAEVLTYNPNLPTSNILSKYYENAYENAWNSSRIVAVTPFLLDYQEVPFDHFSFKKIDSLEYYPFYEAVKNLPKTVGRPIQVTTTELIKGEVYSSIVAGQTYSISLTFKNTGQSIWDGQVKLKTIEGGKELGIKEVAVDRQVEPDQEYTFQISLTAPQKGLFKVNLQLFSENKPFDSPPIQFTTEVKEPVILRVLSKLKWKDSPAGDYILKVSGATGESSRKVILDSSGKSQELEARYLLPDYSFEFSLERPFYHPKTIRREVKAGVNALDFGILQPALFQAILNPKELWKLLPFSN